MGYGDKLYSFYIIDSEGIQDWLDGCFSSMKCVYSESGMLKYKIFCNLNILESYGYSREKLHNECVLHHVLLQDCTFLPEDKFIAFVDMEEFDKNKYSDIGDVLND